MKVLVACEYSGIVRDAFLARGHDAVSCDVLPTESPGPHHQGDVRPLLKQRWDLVISFPPCTYLTTAGLRWLSQPGRMDKVMDAARFFRECQDANAPRTVVENPPRMIRQAKAVVGRGPDTVIQPWYFGDPWVKSMGLWLRGVDPLLPTNVVQPVGRWVSDGTQNDGTRWKGAPRGHRSPHMRSRMFPGIAAAMAERWG